MSYSTSAGKSNYSSALANMPGSSTSTTELIGDGNEQCESVNNDTNSNSQEYFNFYCEQEILNDSLKAEMQKCMWSSCGRMFTQLDDLVNHVNDDHVKMEKETDYTCRWENCSRNGKAFNARYKMLIHVRTHTHEKPHLCGLCGKPFSRLENLKIHNRSHTGEKPYVCTVNGCYKKYSNSSDRFKHIRTHFVDKPYVCRRDGCDKRYTDPSSLRKHMKTYGHNKEGTESTKNGCAKDKACTSKKSPNSQATRANGVKVMQIPVSTEKPPKESRAVSQIPVLPVGVSSLIYNPMISSALTLKSESAKNVRRYMDTNQPFLPSDAMHGVLTDSARSSAADAPKSQAGPLDLTVNQNELNIGVTNGTDLQLKWELSTQ